MEKVSASQFASSAIWRFGELIVRKFITMGISVILARLIAPEAYGVVALTTIFISFSDIFILNGFNVALTRKQSISETDCATVMLLSVGLSAVLYCGIYLAAPYVAAFYKTPELTDVLRTISLMLFFQAVVTVIRAKATREMAFKEMSIASFISSIAAGLVGIFVAYQGYGIWALVLQQILGACFDMILMMLLFKWKFSLRFSISTAKELFGFTAGVLGSSFLEFASNNISNMVTGKVYSPTVLAYSGRGGMIPEIVGMNVFGAINGALLPTLASRQDDTEEIKSVVRKVLSLSIYVIMPMMVGMVAISDRLIPLLLTEKWNPCIPFVAFSALFYALNPIRLIANNVFFARGKSKRAMKLEIIRGTLSVINLIIVCFVLKKGIYFLGSTGCIVTISVILLSHYMLKKEIHYSFRELFDDIGNSVFISLLMLGFVRLIGLLPMGDVTILFLQVVLAVVLYVGLSALTKNSSFIIVWNYLKRFLKKNK